MVNPEDVISKVRVYGIEESVCASKYPFATDLSYCNDDITKTQFRLAQAPAGSGEDTFLHGIVVQFDLTLPITVWKQAERYHFLEFVSSQSTMHKATDFDIDSQCSEFVHHEIKEIIKKLVADYKKAPTAEKELVILDSLPTGFLLTARMTTNYLQLKTIYKQRRMHKHPYWRAFCKWIETLPISTFITGKGE